MQYVNSLIEAIGGIIGAVLGAFIAGGYISKIFKNNIPRIFHTYSENERDVSKIMRKAQKDIYIVASVGDRLLEKYENKIKLYLKKGIHIFFLLHNEEEYLKLEEYLHIEEPFNINFYQQIRETTLEIIKKLKNEFPGQVEVKEFSSFFLLHTLELISKQMILLMIDQHMLLSK